MKTDKYTLVYRESIDDLSAALEEKESLEDRLQEVIARIDDLRQVAYSTANMCNADPRVEYPNFFLEEANPDVGFTDAVRGVFNPGMGLSPVQVRNRLRASGFDLAGYKNPLATIHTILKRLVKAGELFVVPDDQSDGPTTYMMPPLTRPVGKGPNAHSEEIADALGRAIVRMADGIEPSQTKVIQVGAPIAQILRKKDPRWWERMKQSGGIVLSNPPYFVGGTKLTRKQLREVDEAVRESRIEKEVEKLNPKN